MTHLDAGDVSSTDAQHTGGAASLRLLVVDDDLIQRRIIAKIGGQVGHNVHQAATVEEAQEILKNEAVDCVTVDLSLGERSGLEVLSALSAKARNVPVLIISGMPEQVLLSTARYAEECGLVVHGTFTKPLDLGRLRQSLAAVRRTCEVMAPISH